MEKRIKEITVTSLQDTFDYRVNFPSAGDTVILIAPNGYGKTALLSLLHACLQFRFNDAARQSFKTLEVKFVSGERWEFERTNEKREEVEVWRRASARRYQETKSSRTNNWIKFSAYNSRGRVEKDKLITGISAIPQEILGRALDQALPVMREGYDSFRTIGKKESLSMIEVSQLYLTELTHDEDFKKQLGTYANFFRESNSEGPLCVYIDTQRLLYAKRANRPDKETGPGSAPEEEISRQARHLASVLQDAHKNYASTSQGLDRSFPSRLIARAALTETKDTSNLRANLDVIENRRKALTSAGILIETSEPVIMPEAGYLSTVADALAIYVEDSNEKLKTFDDVFKKVSTFERLLSKKLRSKRLIINREQGAYVSRDDKIIDLEGLSSGEKHEFIMLFRLIFETPSKSLVLIDEPEISLHVLWQLEFMSDLRSIQETNYFQSIIATHSPQILQGNEDLIVDLAEQAQ